MFKERIREYYDALTPGFRKLADFIMQNTLDAAFLTASELARRVNVDPATVVRFSQEIGYSGYRELSREIKRYVRDQVTATYREAKEAKTEEDVINVILDNTSNNFSTSAQRRHNPRAGSRGSRRAPPVSDHGRIHLLRYGGLNCQEPRPDCRHSPPPTSSRASRRPCGRRGADDRGRALLVLPSVSRPGTSAGAVRMRHARRPKTVHHQLAPLPWRQKKKKKL